MYFPVTGSQSSALRRESCALRSLSGERTTRLLALNSPPSHSVPAPGVPVVESLSPVQLSATPWPAARQDPPSTGFSM